ncbi:DgyrCDS11357 [Dimorphilus gyrociliatus]|uniref:DgyrCDS11357 n=1 Tax=Dimorphilus gyrociliatus TaxID=2664684 RepID=A0A7I8W422_9ANNE|nr:DgyrCDS11357 [Dimorphilus gyrociliatus]
MTFKKVVNYLGKLYEVRKTDTSLTLRKFRLNLSDNGSLLANGDILLHKEEQIGVTSFVVIDCEICLARSEGRNGICILTQSSKKPNFSVCYVDEESEEFRQLYNFRCKRFSNNPIHFLDGPSLLWVYPEDNVICYVPSSFGRPSSKLKVIGSAVFFKDKKIRISRLLYSKMLSENCCAIMWKYFLETEKEERFHGFLLHDDSADEFDCSQLIPKEYQSEITRENNVRQTFIDDFLLDGTNQLLLIYNETPEKLRLINCSQKDDIVDRKTTDNRKETDKPSATMNKVFSSLHLSLQRQANYVEKLKSLSKQKDEFIRESFQELSLLDSQIAFKYDIWEKFYNSNWIIGIDSSTLPDFCEYRLIPSKNTLNDLNYMELNFKQKKFDVKMSAPPPLKTKKKEENSYQTTCFKFNMDVDFPNDFKLDLFVCYLKEGRSKFLEKITFDVDKALNPTFNASLLNISDDLLTVQRNLLALNTAQLEQKWTIRSQSSYIPIELLVNILKLRLNRNCNSYAIDEGSLAGIRLTIGKESISTLKLTCFANDNGQMKLLKCALRKHLPADSNLTDQ